MKTKKQQINSFFSAGKIAIAGVSRSPKKFGYQVFHELKEKKYPVIPLNPNADTIDGESCYKSLDKLPAGTDSLLILTPKHETDKLLREAISKGIKNIWIQQMSETPESMKIASEAQKEIILGKCVFMFAEPVKGVHKFHRSLVKFFGGLPK